MRAHLLTVVGVAMVTVLAGSVYSFTWSGQQAKAAAVDRMSFQSQRAAESIAKTISTAEKVVAGLAAQPGLAAAFVAGSGCSLQLEGGGAFPGQRLDLVRADGVVTCTSRPSSTPDAAVHADSGWLTQTLTRRAPLVVTDAVDAQVNQRAVAVTAPVAAASGPEPAGAAVIFLHAEPAAAAMRQAFGGADNVGFTLLDRREGEILSSEADVDPSASRQLSGDTSRAGTLRLTEGDDLVYGSADVAGTDWRVIAGVPQDAVLSEARGALVRQLSLGGLALAVLIGGAWLLNHRIARPLSQLTRAAEAAHQDSDAPRVREAGTAETVQLARAFNRMLDIRAGHEAQLAYHVGHDALTGLPNKASLVLDLDQALADGRSVAVVCLGLDRFRHVNDAVGHLAGDRLLQEVAARLTGIMREGDTLARFGSDEFVLLCVNVSPEDVSGITTRTQSAFDAPFHGPLGDITLTATAGVAAGTGPDVTSGQLLREADSALHEAKSGSEPLRQYDKSIQARATTHLTLQQDLALAIERDQLIVHYQPLVDLATGRVVGAEALVRWLHPERGLIPPNDFIPLAEQTGQITAVGEYVLNQACAQAVRWAVAGHPLTVSVNVAAAQLRSNDFLEVVTRAIDSTGLAPAQLCLEITESSLMTASAGLIDDLQRLRQSGVELALDDFGTGYSSLSYLQQLPCDELKIDRSFVSRLDDGNRELHLVTAIIAMARALGLTVVAEGVETDKQRRLLSGLDCHQAQGYLFSRPVTHGSFSTILESAVPLAKAARRMRLA